MKLDRRLNLVLTVEQNDGSMIYVHSTPISREVYEANFLLLTKTLAAMYEQGLSPAMCARVAGLMLKKTAAEMNQKESDALERNLMPEIRRLTNVILLSGKGWETVPYQEIVDRDILSRDDRAEVENHLCFFTAASWIHRKEELEKVIYPILNGSGYQTVSSSCTEFAASLPTSMPDANTGATAQVSSIPV